MNTHTKRIATLLAVLAIATVLLIAGAALAQRGLVSTEPGGDFVEAPGSFDSADWLNLDAIPAGVIPDGGVPSAAGEADSQSATEGEAAPQLDGFQHLEGLAPDDNPVRDAPEAADETFSYYMVSGATLNGRSSSTGYTYNGNGCSYVDTGSGVGRILNTDMHLPAESVIKYLRVYYNDTNASGSVSGFITRYAPGTATSDLVNVSSTTSFSGGYGFAVSSEITETVNNASYAYTLIGWPSDLGSTLQICGLRVAYYAPTTIALFLPVSKR